MPSNDCRITENSDTSIPGMIAALSGGNIGAMNVIMEWIERDGPMAFPAILTVLDMKHLYDHHIWVVYSDVCGRDIDRFIYHVSMELPNQVTGKLSTSGPYRSQVNDEFYKKRTFGTPGSYWALQEPPHDPNYAYPIV